jgi:nucleoside-diphosphate-sugar epimerase
MSAYARRRVLVIGGLGFIGSNLVTRLVREEAVVTAVTPRRDRHPELALELESTGVSVFEADIRDAEAMRVAVAGQDAVFNVAGQSGAVRSMEDPWTDLDVNLRGTLVLLEALRTSNHTAKLVVAGSRLQYGRAEALPVAEEAHRAPTCLHAVHKSTIEAYLEVYQRLFGLRYTAARITNPYGPGQPASTTAYGVINQMIHLALGGRTLTIYGDGAQLRDYVFIDDLVEALLRLGADADADGRVYNIGSGRGTSLVDLARRVIDLAGDGRIAHVPWPELAERIETGDFVADVSRLKGELGWEPATTLAEGLARTIAFYRARVTN